MTIFVLEVFLGMCYLFFTIFDFARYRLRRTDAYLVLWATVYKGPVWPICCPLYDFVFVINCYTVFIYIG